MGFEILYKLGVEVSYTYTNKGCQLDRDKIRILRQINDNNCVYLIVGYEAKGNHLLFDDPL